jgi:hypothetical protein
MIRSCTGEISAKSRRSTQLQNYVASSPTTITFRRDVLDVSRLTHGHVLMKLALLTAANHIDCTHLKKERIYFRVLFRDLFNILMIHEVVYEERGETRMVSHFKLSH